MNKYKLILLALSMTGFVQAKVTLPSFFTNNMVIQQNSTLTLPGKAKAGKKVTVKASWNDNKFTTKATVDGSFRIEIPTPAAGGPYTITISDGETLTLKNVLAGEVWFCSGQSNMEMPVAGWGKVMNYEQEVAEAKYSSIRLLQVKKTIAFTPAEDVEINMGGWQECSSATVPEFSAVAYFYARELWKELNVPIGVIDCTWGGTPAEAWTSLGTLKQVIGFQDETSKIEKLNFDKASLVATYQQDMKEWQELFAAKDAGLNKGTPLWTSSLQTDKAWKTMELPGYWEGRGLDGVDGIVWFQREIEIPTNWEGKDISLSLGMIDDEDITYYNGKEIAKGYGYATPRRYTIPAELVKAGKGTITVRVADFGGEGGIHGEKKDLFAEVNEQKISLNGVWNYRVGMTMRELPPAPVSPESSSYPSVLYNAMVHPFTIFPIKGVIWYQGEANVGRDKQYVPLFQSLIADWRKQWNTDFPFYFVQLANFLKPQEVQPDSQWAALREAQAEALHVDNTGMVVAIDLGVSYDIHPKNKQEVAKRFATLALANTYHQGEYKMPACQSYNISGKKLTLTFNTEIQAQEKIIKGFILAGPDGVFYPATATLTGKTSIVLESPDVAIPIAARYNWADCPDGNLYSTNSNLPVPPFRTDKGTCEEAQK
ncbi:sialate O-acetylesterase [Bacteroides nordii]|uniref:sialate O-acetylesterase n=1 Tax=Bacteroides nordii TaxID=291645 RepID=UPI00203C760A|nr:sialate O-acetylesterase [Bacteroides nordii]GFZ37996.1 9-O-acetylesterase [Bacteroides nordii]